MATTPSLSASEFRGLLVLTPAGFMPPRLLLVPAGTLLPPGVHAVAVAPAPGVGNSGALFVLAPPGSRVPPAAHAALAALGAAPGSGRRGATRCVAAGAGSEAGNTADDDDAELRAFLEAQADVALALLSELAPPAAPLRVARYNELKEGVIELVSAAKSGKDDKMGRAISLVRASYALVRIAHWIYPNAALPPLPLEQRFVSLCLGTDPKEEVVPAAESLGDLTPLLGFDLIAREVGEGDAGLIKGVMTAVSVATTAARTARYLAGCCGGQAGQA